MGISVKSHRLRTCCGSEGDIHFIRLSLAGSWQVRFRFREAGRIHRRSSQARKRNLHRNGDARPRQDTSHDHGERQRLRRPSCSLSGSCFQIIMVADGRCTANRRR